jgi:uncharacterized membrane protein
LTSNREAGISPVDRAERFQRRPYIDWARGVAVLIMIGAHILDSWTAAAERQTSAFGVLNLIAGYAAPLFLWLAGLSLVLAADRRLFRGADRHAAAMSVFRRGALVFALAFLFRLQAFVVSPGNPLVSLLRVDILNVMGPSMMASALLWRMTGGPRTAAGVLGAAALAVAMVTPIVRNATGIAVLPPIVQWYLTPEGSHSTFTLLPWSGFVFAGGSFGALLGMTAPSEEHQAIARLTIAGVLLGVIAAYLATRPSIYSVSSFWTTSPTYFAIRVALLVVLLGGLYAVMPIAYLVSPAFEVLERLGRHSLFVYWIHVELVYGYATLPLHRRLPLWGTGIGFVLFSAAMYWSVGLTSAAGQIWRSRHPRAPTAQTASA